MKKSGFWVRFAGATAVQILAFVANSGFATNADELQRGFRNPPPSSRPWVLYFPLDGNLSSNGITADLEAMQRVGIGGVVMMETEQGTPKGPARFGGPLWRDLFKHTCAEAARLGLEVNMNNDAGWCGSGGPFITPELSMQRVVWSETAVVGPSHFDAVLQQPEAISNYYRDIVVVAVPTPADEDGRMLDHAPKFTSSAGEVPASRLTDGDPVTEFVLPKPKTGKSQFVQLEFPQPFAARQLNLTLGGSYRRLVTGRIEVSDDGKKFRPVREFDTKPPWVKVGFDQVTARFWRVVFTKVDAKLDRLGIAELDLRPAFGLDLLHAKAAVITRPVPLQTDFAQLPTGLTIARDKVIPLSSHMQPDGRLTWDVPAGRWTILRFGHTTTGQNNYPAPLEGRGLESDKLSKEATEAAFDGLLGKLLTDVGPLAGKGKTLIGTHIDSWEVNSQNWTPKFREEFKRRRGYDPLVFLPALTGRVVDSLEITERFLWDWRMTVHDLVVENYAGHFRTLANRRGLRLTIEAYDYSPCDELTYGGRADEPMAEFWAWGRFSAAWSCTEMASSAHVYGKQILGAEAFTSTSSERWQGHPGNIKDIGDWAFCEGINRFVIHRYALQPWADRRPGMSMGPWGLHYERTQTWWEQSKAWHEYLMRCQFLLQQGRWVADVCYLAPENSPQRWSPPQNRDAAKYNFDGCPPEVVLTRMQVKDGRIVLPDGMSYRLLVLPESRAMTPRLLRKISELVQDGATVIGPRPLKSPSLADFPAGDDELKQLADKLWGDGEGNAAAERRFGKGRVVWGKAPEELLAEMNVPPDFSCLTASPNRPLRYTHRTIGDTEVYFVANKETNVAVQTVCAFRVPGLRPEFWWPDTGRIEHPAVYDEVAGCVRVPVSLDPSGSVFVIFRKAAASEPDRIVSVSRNGEPLIDLARQPTPPPATNAKRVTNNFTMATWVRPEVDTTLPKETSTGTGGNSLIRNDALYPPPGHEVFADTNHAGSGLAVGRNGVVVFEHGDHHFAPVLVHAVRLTNWTHVALVYRAGKAELFLNGELVRTGLKSRFMVHPGVGVAHGRSVPAFRGQLGEFATTDRAANAREVVALMKAMPRPEQSPAPGGSLDLLRGDSGGGEAVVWQPGDYRLKRADGRESRVEVPTVPAAEEIAGAWEVAFAPGWGAPPGVKFDRLISWSEHDDLGVKYFSGTAVYRKEFPYSAPAGASRRVYLELGQVAVMADVRLNGSDLGTLWKAPFRVDVTDVLRSGANDLEVKVANLWINRMIGDERLPEDSERNANGTLKSWPQWLAEGRPSPTGRFTFTSWRLWKQDEPLVESGLIGPVRLITAPVVKF